MMVIYILFLLLLLISDSLQASSNGDIGNGVINKLRGAEDDADGLPESIRVTKPLSPSSFSLLESENEENIIIFNENKYAECKALYVYLEGCPIAHRVYADGDKGDVTFGTKSEIEGYPISVEQHGSYDLLNWKHYIIKYWVFMYSIDTLYASKSVSKASWFRTVPSQPFMVSRVINGRREYESFHADVQSCSSNFAFRLDYSGLKIFVEKCVN